MCHYRSCAEVYCDGEISFALIACFDVHYLGGAALPADCYGNFIICTLQQRRELLKNAKAGLNYRGVNLLTNSQIQSLVVCGVVADAWGGHL